MDRKIFIDLIESSTSLRSKMCRLLPETLTRILISKSLNLYQLFKKPDEIPMFGQVVHMFTGKSILILENQT